jgi:hypothetical protein
VASFAVKFLGCMHELSADGTRCELVLDAAPQADILRG